MNAQETLLIACPYCGESIEILVECSLDEQEYIEDCSVCCRPINLKVTCGYGKINVDARREDEC